MFLSQLHVSRLGRSILCLMVTSIGACASLDQAVNPNPATSPTISPITGSEAKPTNTVPTVADSANGAANSTATEELTAILGTQADGWLPKVLAQQGLERGLTPAATGKIIPGAEQVSNYGFSKVKVNTIPGLKQYEFYYAQDSSGKPTKLEAVKLHFDPALNSAYPDLVKVLSDKYGAVKPEDLKQQTLVWVGPGFVTAQLTKQVTDFGGYELNVSLEQE